MITQKRLKELLHYDPETGVFINIVYRGSTSEIGSIAGCMNNQGNWVITINYKIYKASRLAFLYMEGYFPEEADHKDRDKSNNKWDNLRAATRVINNINRGLMKNNKSGVTGVCRHKEKWSAQIGSDNKTVNLGIFSDFMDAVKARWNAEKLYGWRQHNTISSAHKYIMDNS